MNMRFDPTRPEPRKPWGEWAWALFLAVSVLMLTWMFLVAASGESTP